MEVVLEDWMEASGEWEEWAEWEVWEGWEASVALEGTPTV